jgi:hypothetical protein
MYPAFRDHVPGFADWFAEIGRSHADDSAVGDTFWMPLRADARPHGVVVVVAAGGPATAEDKAAIAARAAIDEAVRRLRDEVGEKGRLLIALPAFRIGMGGDRDQQLRSARAQIASAREALTRPPGVDVTFLGYTPAIYRVFLEARRLEPGTPRPGPEIPPALERSLIDGECVLFVGAGLSRGAGLPDWGSLVARMAEELGLATHVGLDYLDLAQWYREKLGDDAPGRLVAATFADPDPPPKPTLAHYLAMSLPASFVITTNYDDLLERTLSALKRYPVTVVDQAEVAGTGGADGMHLVKLHGEAVRPDRIVLCLAAGVGGLPSAWSGSARSMRSWGWGRRPVIRRTAGWWISGPVRPAARFRPTVRPFRTARQALAAIPQAPTAIGSRPRRSNPCQATQQPARASAIASSGSPEGQRRNW